VTYSDPERQKEYIRDYRRRVRRERREKFMADKVCEDCGAGSFLELHHVDPAQKDTHRIWGWSWLRILKEAKKCIVLCETCHDRRHPNGGRWRKQARRDQ
jgi:hypothetical protein